MASVPRSKEALREILAALSCDDSDFYLDLVGEAKAQMDEACEALKVANKAADFATAAATQSLNLYNHYVKTYNDVVALQEGIREEQAKPDPGLKKVGARRKKESLFALSQEFQNLYPLVVDYYQTEEYPSTRRCAEVHNTSKYKIEVCRKSGISNGEIIPISRRLPASHLPGSIKTWAYGNISNLHLGDTIKVAHNLFVSLVNKTRKVSLCVGCGNIIDPGSKSIHFIQTFGTTTDHYYYHLGKIFSNECVVKIRPDLPEIKVWYMEEQDEVG